MLTKFYMWLRLRLHGLFAAKPVKLAIVRRYADANGSYVGELYMEGNIAGVSAYRMIGVSLDTLPIDAVKLETWRLDTLNDFLVPMSPETIRVGAIDPKDNDSVRKMVRKLPRKNMTLIIQNRFIEHVLENKV
jgi:hypothetical protein